MTRRHNRQPLMKRLSKNFRGMKESPLLMVGFLTLGATVALGGVVWAVSAVISWSNGGLPSDLPEKPDFEAISKMPEEQRKVVLAYYGRNSTRRFSSDRNRDGNRPDSRNLSEEERKNFMAERQKRREDMQKLSDEDRGVMRKAAMEERHNEMKKEMEAFFALSKEDQTKKLDERIDQMVARQKEHEKRRAEAETKAKTSGTQTDSKGRGSNPGHSRTRSTDPDKRQERFKSRLDESSPEDRAMFTAYFTALRERAKERGVTMSFGGPGGGRR